MDRCSSLIIQLLRCGLALLLPLPALADEVNVYTERQEVFLRDIFTAFTATTAIKVNVLYLDKGSVERLASEGEHTVADLVIVADVGRVQALEDAGLTQPLEPGLLDAVSVPVSMRPQRRHWAPLTRRLRVLFVREDDPTAIADFSELAAPEWEGGLCMRSGFHPYNIALFANYLGLHGEDDARSWINGVRANLARKPQGNDRAQIKGVANGRCRAAVANLYYYYKMLNSDNEAERRAAQGVRWLPLRVDASGAHANISGAAIARHSKRPQAAAQLLEFMLSPEAQRMYASANYELPIRSDVSMPAELEQANEVSANSLSLDDIARLRSAAAELVEEAGFDD